MHPRLAGSRYPNGDLCGAAVAFKLAWQVCKSFGDGKRASPQLRDFLVRSLGLVALATIADMVPLSDENRILVRHGLAGILAEPERGLESAHGGQRAASTRNGCPRERSASGLRPGSTRPAGSSKPWSPSRC